MPHHKRTLIPSLLVCLAWCSTTAAALPIVERFEPMGVVRGEESTVTLYGKRLADAYMILCDIPGIEILEVKPIDNKSVTERLKAESTLDPGLYPIRLVTKSGIANLRLLGVGTMPIVKEVEPNNDFTSPQAIKVNCTIEGMITNEDADHYAIDLSAGETINVEIEGIRLHYTLNNQNILDPYVAILDDKRFELATSDDSALLRQDGVCSLTAPRDGRYTLMVRDSSFRGSPVSGYRLHVGTFPRPIATIPAGGTPGSTLEARLILLDNTETFVSIVLPTEPADRWPLVTESDRGITPSPNWIRVNDLPVVMEQEPNNNHRKAPTTSVPVAFCGVIEEENDFDCIAFELSKGQKYRVECFSRNLLRSPLDAVMNVFGPDDKSIAGADDVGGAPDPFIEFTAAVDGRHTLRIFDHLRGGGPTHHYRIEVTAASPGFSLSLKESRRYESETVSVPIAGRTAMMVTANRQGYGGEIRLSLEDLPDGVTATAYPMPAGRAEVPVLLTASEDAAHSASLFDVTGRGDEGAEGSFAQRHKLVLGQNRRPMWTFDTTRAAMAVTKAAPLTIELVEPMTPIVRSGSKNLRVRITRQEGFDAPVTLRTLYNPPGVAVNNSRKIDKGQSEVEIPITANGSAAIGKWPMILVARYPSERGPATIATPAISLDVQDSLVQFEFPKSAVQQGSETSITIGIDVLREYEGDAEIELAGLPNGVTSPTPRQPITKDSTSVTFPIVVAADAKIGNHKTLVCITTVQVQDEVITQTTGTGELRVDPPPPAKQDAPQQDAPKPQAAPPPKPPADKPLSRLEQLRQQKEEKR